MTSVPVEVIVTLMQREGRHVSVTKQSVRLEKTFMVAPEAIGQSMSVLNQKVDVVYELEKAQFVVRMNRLVRTDEAFEARRQNLLSNGWTLCIGTSNE